MRILAIGLSLLTYPALAASSVHGCYEGSWLVRELGEVHGQFFTPLPGGEVISAEDWRLASYVSPETGEWTLVAHYADRSACVLRSSRRGADDHGP
jgi:hypothetical protein